MGVRHPLPSDEPQPLPKPVPVLTPVLDVPYVYAVAVENRVDGLYVFAERPDADRFRDAVIRHGGEAVVSEEPLIGTFGTDELVQAEVDGDG